MARRGNGEGTIYRRKDGRWEGRLSDPSGRRREVFYARTRAEVAQKVNVALKGQQDGLPITRARLTVGTYMATWLESARPGLRPRTFARYEQYVRIHALPAIGRVPLARLGPQDLECMYAARMANGSSAGTVVHLHAVMHRALAQAARWGLCPRNVATLVTPPRTARTEMRAFSPDHARAFLAAAVGDRLEGLYVLALTTGMRQGELIGLRWRDVDLDAASIRIQTSLQRDGRRFVFVEPKTAGSRRQIVLGDAAVSALRRWRIRQAEERLAVGPAWEDNGLVFTNAIGQNTLGVLRTSFPALLARADVPRIRFHDLRHTAATLLLGQGVHPKIVSEMLGHSTIAITLDLYSHVTPTMQQEAASLMDAIVGQARGRL